MRDQLNSGIDERISRHRVHVSTLTRFLTRKADAGYL
jgi:hypothetical protein